MNTIAGARLAFGLMILISSAALYADDGEAPPNFESPAQYVEFVLNEWMMVQELNFDKRKLRSADKFPPKEKQRMNRFSTPAFFDEQGISVDIAIPAYLANTRRFKVVDAGGPYVDVQLFQKGCPKKKRRTPCATDRYKVALTDDGYTLVPGKSTNVYGWAAPYWKRNYYYNSEWQELTTQEISEKITRVAASESGVWPWVENEIGEFYKDARTIKLETPSSFDTSIVCQLRSLTTDTTRHSEFVDAFAPLLVKKFLSNPMLLPGKIRILEQPWHYNSEFGLTRSSQFSETVFRYSSEESFLQSKSLPAVRDQLWKPGLETSVETPLRGAGYYIFGYVTSYNSARKSTSFVESLPETYKYFSVVARLKFSNGVLVQNTVDTDSSYACSV